MFLVTIRTEAEDSSLLETELTGGQIDGRAVFVFFAISHLILHTDIPIKKVRYRVVAGENVHRKKSNLTRLV